MTRTWRSWRWRGAYVVVLVAAVGALVAGIAYGALTASGLGTGSASTGSVTLTTTASHTCSYTTPPLTPGTSMTACSFQVTYGGSISAYVGLDVLIETTKGSGVGAHTLYDGSNSTGLTFSIIDNGGKSFTVPTSATTCPAGAPAGSICYELDDELAAWYGGSTPSLTFTNTSPAVTWTITPNFPKTAGNAYQGATASLVLTALAVQAPANALPGTCTTSTIGKSCPANGSFAWS
jgi:hypothetical protein